jgi:hypothetical protein
MRFRPSKIELERQVLGKVGRDKKSRAPRFNGETHVLWEWFCIRSVHQQISLAGHASEAALKHCIMMMRSVAREVAPHHIRMDGLPRGDPDSHRHNSRVETYCSRESDGALALPMSARYFTL